MKPAKIFLNDTELVPPDPRFAYLLDPNFTLDISQTIYTEKDLPTLCDEENNWWIDPEKRLLKPRWRVEDPNRDRRWSPGHKKFPPGLPSRRKPRR